MAQRRLRAIEDSVRMPGRSTTEVGTSARQRSGPKSPLQQADSEATHGEIRRRIEKLAYELYQQRGRQDGYDRQDWLEAERLTLEAPPRARQDSSDDLPASSPASRVGR
ncbi:MAG: DUF2934 domain-containing protein [Nitrospira sp.]|nr:DUF2934 domain-containing protein [Nitrospira sp.]